MKSLNSLETVHDSDQNVLQAPVFSSFIIESHINSLVFDCPAIGIADIHPQGAEDDNGIHPIQCPALPFVNLVEHRIRLPG